VDVVGCGRGQEVGIDPRYTRGGRIRETSGGRSCPPNPPTTPPHPPPPLATRTTCANRLRRFDDGPSASTWDALACVRVNCRGDVIIPDRARSAAISTPRVSYGFGMGRHSNWMAPTASSVPSRANNRLSKPINPLAALADVACA